MTFATATVKPSCHLNERCAVYSFIGQVNKAQAAWISNKVVVEERPHDVM